MVGVIFILLEQNLLPIAMQLVDGVAFLHRVGVALCDLAPSHVMVKYGVKVLIIDHDWAI